MRREPEFFDSRELELLYIARRLRDALQIEELLTASGIEYAVEPDRYHGGVIFRTERVGAFFYVLPETLPDARTLLSANGFTAATGIQP